MATPISSRLPPPPAHLEPGGRGRSASSRAMPRGPRPGLWPLLLPLLLAVGLGQHGRAGPREAAEEAGSGPAWRAVQGLRERLRAAGTLSKRYWALFACRVWPEACEQDEEAAAYPQGKTGARPPCRGREPAAGCARLSPAQRKEAPLSKLAPVLGRRLPGRLAGALAAGFTAVPSLGVGAGSPVAAAASLALPPLCRR